MNAPDLSADVFAFWQSFNGGQPILSDADRERFTAAFVAIVDELDPRWGRKSRDATTPVSNDTIAYWLGAVVPTGASDGTVDARDLINGTTGAAQFLGAGDPKYDGIVAHWTPVQTAPPPPPPPPPPPADGDEFDQLVHDVERIADGMDTIAATLVALLERVDDVSKRGLIWRLR